MVNLTREELLSAKWIHSQSKFGHRINSIKIYPFNTMMHELTKTMVAFDLIQGGSNIYTECIFRGGGKADIVDITNATIIEILGSERESSFLKKADYYPQDYDIIPIKTKELDKYLKKYMKSTKE